MDGGSAMYGMGGVASWPQALVNESMRFGQFLGANMGLLSVAVWTVVVTACGVGLTFLTGSLTRRQAKQQIELQMLISHRTTAAFVADKRQKWIDELRTEMAFQLALSQEMLWKWDAVRSRTALRVQEEAKDAEGKLDPVKQEAILQAAADAFSVEHGARDREHQERHIRLMLRLNPKEPLHVMLRERLEKIRDAINRTQGANSQADARKLLHEGIAFIEQAQQCTQDILKAEWQRVKQEVAYPDVLMSTIPKPPANPA